MPKYIDKDKLINRLDEHYVALVKKCGFDDEYVRGYGDVISDMDDEPAADVREVKHAKWIQRGEDAVYSNCGQLTEDYCIEGDSESGYYTVLPHYCSACEALMDLEDD